MAFAIAVKMTVLVKTIVGRPIQVARVNGLNKNLYLVRSQDQCQPIYPTPALLFVINSLNLVHSMRS